jgi:hypothetical protein
MGRKRIPMGWAILKAINTKSLFRPPVSFPLQTKKRGKRLRFQRGQPYGHQQGGNHPAFGSNGKLVATTRKRCDKLKGTLSTVNPFFLSSYPNIKIRVPKGKQKQPGECGEDAGGFRCAIRCFHWLGNRECKLCL